MATARTTNLIIDNKDIKWYIAFVFWNHLSTIKEKALKKYAADWQLWKLQKRCRDVSILTKIRILQANMFLNVEANIKSICLLRIKGSLFSDNCTQSYTFIIVWMGGMTQLTIIKFRLILWMSTPVDILFFLSVYIPKVSNPEVELIGIAIQHIYSIIWH